MKVFQFLGGGMIMVLCWLQSCPQARAADDFQPFIEQARKRSAQPGSGPVIVTIPRGEYLLEKPLRITPDISGTADRPVIFRVKEPAKTRFSSAKPLPAMRQTEAGYWTCELPAGFILDQLFVDGARSEPARFPQQGYMIMQGVQQMVDHQGSNKRFAEKATQTINLDDHAVKQLTGIDLSHARMYVLHKWDCTLRNGLVFDGKQKTIVTKGGGMKDWNKWRKGTRFFLQNVAGDQLAPGHWMIKGRTFLYAPRPGEKLGETSLLAPQLEKLLIVQGEQTKPVQHIRFEGFRWMHSTLNLPHGMPPNQAASTSMQR